MKYYKDRVEAFAAIDKMVVDGMDEEDICFKIATMYGYGTKFVQDRIKALQRMVEKKAGKKEGDKDGKVLSRTNSSETGTEGDKSD